LALLSPVIYGRGHAVVGAIDCGSTSMRLRLDFGSPDGDTVDSVCPDVYAQCSQRGHTHTHMYHRVWQYTPTERRWS